MTIVVDYKYRYDRIVQIVFEKRSNSPIVMDDARIVLWRCGRRIQKIDRKNNVCVIYDGQNGSFE